MNVEPWRRELDVAVGVVREAAILAREIRRQVGTQAFLKADQSPVTVADFAVQALVAHRLGRAFPDDPLIAEEDSAGLRGPPSVLHIHHGHALWDRHDLDREVLASVTDYGSALDDPDRGAGCHLAQ